jgi:hypothetical protein
VRDELISDLSRDFGVHPYGKWRGAFWRLISLLELGSEPGDPHALAAAEQSLAWLCNPRRLKTIHQRRIEGRVRRCASQDGRGLQASLRIGLCGDPRLDTLAESLVETQWPDGGWNCDLRPEASHSSLKAYSERTGQPAHPVLMKLHYPAYWHYDLLVGLRTLAGSAGLSDPRTADALDVLESKRRPDGTWRCEGEWWKRPGSQGSNVEAVDWGDAADELLTEQARDVLTTAGRL